MKNAAILKRKRERGAALIEFGLIALIFFSILIGIMELGRVLFTYNSAVEATRYGARIAVVCNAGSRPVVLSKMQQIMPALTDTNLILQYPAAGCEQASCARVTVGIQNFQVQTVIPLIGLTFTLPQFTTALPRESMSSTGNSICA